MCALGAATDTAAETLDTAVVDASELAHLEGDVYLDYAGAGVYRQSQVEALHRELAAGGYGNPHSNTRGGNKAREKIAELRAAVLDHFSVTADDYAVVLTSGATGALKTVAHNFPFGTSSSYTVLENNHNSVLGIRGVCLNKGGLYASLPLESFPPSAQAPAGAPSLVAAPLLCNFTGVVVPTAWCHTVRQRGWYSLVDAAAAFGKGPVDLSLPENQPDFVVVSFYKAFGMPTGMGALLVRSGSADVLRRTYFGGGTLVGASAREAWEQRKPDVAEGLEDGTQSFLDVSAVLHGMHMLQRMGMASVGRRLSQLTLLLSSELAGLRHSNGAPVCELYTHGAAHAHSCVVAFNLHTEDGQPVGYNSVVEVANCHKIHIRGGCFCNPGACHRFLGISLAEAKQHLAAGHVCGDALDVVDGKATGALRASLGLYSTAGDVRALVACLRDCFVSKTARFSGAELAHSGVLTEIHLYPVKGARGVVVVGSWPVCSAGLVFDRHWCVLRADEASPLSRKQLPMMGDLQPVISVARGTLTLVHLPTRRHVEVPLIPAEDGSAAAAGGGGWWGSLRRNAPSPTQAAVRGTSRAVAACGADVNAWLSEVLGEPGLVLCRRRDAASLSNTSAFLVINEGSVDELGTILNEEVDRRVFRANLVLRCGGAWEEDCWGEVSVGDVVLGDTVPCVRCTQINIGLAPPYAHSPLNEPLRTLMKLRRQRGRAMFGIGASPRGGGGEGSDRPVLSADHAYEVAAALFDPAAEPFSETELGAKTSLRLSGHVHLNVGDGCTVTKTCPSML